MKVCIHCAIQKEDEEFYRHPQMRGGRDSKCKECAKIAARRHHAENREACNARNRDYGERHKEHLREWAKGWAAENAERIRAYKQEHYKTRQEWYQQYREDNRQKRAIYEATRRARKAASAGNFTLEEWQAKCEEFGYRCYLCGGQLTEETAVMEHVMPLSRGGAHTIDNIKPACAPCNNEKHNKTVEEYLKTRRP